MSETVEHYIMALHNEQHEYDILYEVKENKVKEVKALTEQLKVALSENLTVCDQRDELQTQLHKAEERYIFLQKRIIQLQAKLDIAVEAIIEAIGWYGDEDTVREVLQEALTKIKGE